MWASASVRFCLCLCLEWGFGGRLERDGGGVWSKMGGEWEEKASKGSE